MKKLLVIIVLLFMGPFIWAQQGGKKQKQTVVYTCVMHPEVQMSKPGNCPKCGMKLIEKKVKEAATQPRQNKMKQPKDTSKPIPMNMGKKDTMHGVDNRKPAQPVTYTCVMHPEIHATQPGNCPKCGMKLVKESPKISPPSNHPDHDDMQMPIKDSAAKMGNINSMDMRDNSTLTENIKVAKENLGPLKFIAATGPPRTVRYDLYIADTIVNFSGKLKRAIAVNGQIPMPTLIFTEGDTAEIYVHNNLNEETALHWHGLFLPNRMDGVPNLTQMPIKPHTTYLYKFPIVQHGTHWYHSHSGLQEQIGMYGAFIMNKRKEWDIPTIPIVLSEWIDMKPREVQRSLHAATDWFAIQKGATQSYAEAIKTGYFKTKVTNEWKRMTAMDVSDVFYDKFLINGKNQDIHPQYKAGDKVRLRIANGGASDYFWLTYSGGKITVVATDGNDVEPVEVDRLIIAVSETYDVVVTIPDNKSYEFLVTPEDRTKFASLWIGSGEKVPAPKLPRLKYFAGMKMMNEMMDMKGDLIPMEGMEMRNQIMDMNTVMYPEITGEEQPKKQKREDTAQAHDMHNMSMPGKDIMQDMNMTTETTDIVTLNYEMLRAPAKTALPPGPLRELYFTLSGNMNRYVWSLDNKVVSESDRILIRKGENIRLILYNNSMMRHPMHLHGHDFRVLNGQGEHAPLKNIIDMMPMERDTIEFAATEPGGDWFFHCHILYHMMSGMGRIFRYDNNLPNPEIPNPKLAQRKLFADDRMVHLMGRIGLESNGSDGEIMFANTRYRLQTEWRVGLKSHHGYESESHFGRYFGKMQWLFPYIGWDFRNRSLNDPFEKNLFGQSLTPKKNLFGQTNTKNFRQVIHVGIEYTLPMLIIADGSIDSEGKFRFQLRREDIPVSKRLRFNFSTNTDKEYMFGFRYIVSKYFNLSTHFDSDMGLGAGITLVY